MRVSPAAVWIRTLGAPYSRLSARPSMVGAVGAERTTSESTRTVETGTAVRESAVNAVAIIGMLRNCNMPDERDSLLLERRLAHDKHASASRPIRWVPHTARRRNSRSSIGSRPVADTYGDVAPLS